MNTAMQGADQHIRGSLGFSILSKDKLLKVQREVLLKIILRVLPVARGKRWIELTVDEQRAYVMSLLDALEVTDRDKRLKVARAILYLAQGA